MRFTGRSLTPIPSRRARYAVFCPNVRGPIGYGHRFLEMNAQTGVAVTSMYGWGRLLIARIVDAERLGIAGWSYGGYMSMWAVTQTNRFKLRWRAGLSDLE